MKRSIVIITVLAALVLGTATVSATPTVYGRLHLSMDYLIGGTSGAETNKDAFNLSSNSSRIGFKGELEAGKGIFAIYQLEGTVDVDIRGGQFATRDSFGGIRSPFGTLRLGYFDTPLKDVRSKTDFFGDQIGDARNMTFGNDHRFRNSVAYTSPALGPIVVDAQVSLDQRNQATTLNNSNWAMSAAATFSRKGMYASAAYEIRKSQTADSDESALRLGAFFDAGPLRVSAFFQHYSPTKLSTLKEYLTLGGGVRFGMGDLDLKGQFYMVSSDNTQANGSLLALGADYKLGKNLRLMAAFAMAMNQDNAAFSSSAGGHGSAMTPLAGENQTSISLGTRIDF